VALFAERARRADAHFVLDEATSPVVARLVRRLDGMPLAIELAAARVEALGVIQLLNHLDDRFDLLTTGDRLVAGRHQSLAATVGWSYQLLDERERRAFRAVSVFPGPFTLEGAEAVAGDQAGPAVLRLVDCSLLTPPRQDPDGRSRYVMLETLRAYGAGLLAEAEERERAAIALAGYALEVAERAAAGLATTTGELAAARWLDAEDATMRQALAWAMQHDVAVALRLAAALAPWWHLRGRSPGGYPLLREAARSAAPDNEGWGAAQYWLGRMAMYHADLAAALSHFSAVRDAIGHHEPSRARADCLSGRSVTLSSMDRAAEAVDDARRSLVLSRELGYHAGEAKALGALSIARRVSGDFDGAAQLARQALQLPADVPGWIIRANRRVLTFALLQAGDLAAAERSCAAGLAAARDVDDLQYQASMLTSMVNLDLRAGRLEEAAEHLRESLRTATRAGGLIDVLNDMACCGDLCVATGRYAEAVTVWAARDVLVRQDGFGFTDSLAEVRSRDASLARIRQVLGKDRVQAATDRGAAMSLATATEYALMLTAPDPQPKPPGSLAGLSMRERELVTLVARGRTDAQIADQLFISIRTVRSHLDRIRDKTGCRRRADLTRLALTAGLV
jgi:DNA-binding CsgD family transcriptional regulator/tetratricopeptide (TPR) repeat protein